MGSIALVAGAVVATVAGAFAPIKPEWERRTLAMSVVLLWLAAAHVLLLLVREDTSYEIVVDHTRPGLDVFRRMMGLWGGSAGSLLFFTIVVGSVLLSAPLQRPLATARPFVVAVLAWASVLVASPFERLTTPAISGSGLSPILEHWAMLVHPPLLYVGLALSLVPGAVAAPARRSWTAAALAVLTSSLALGGSWAYVELGWGGWWAWDPVENAALLPWLLLVAAVHLRPEHRAAHALQLLVWPAVFGGAAMTRTSLRTSVHAFANSEALGWVLWPLTIGVMILAVVHARRHTSGSWNVSRRVLMPVVIITWTAVVVAAGTFRPFVPGEATDGSFYARFLFPGVIVGLVGLGVVPRLATSSSQRLVGEASVGAILGVLLGAVAGWSTWWQLVLAGALTAGITTTIAGGLRPVVRTLAHLGMLCVIAGALGGTASTTQTFSLQQGASAEIDGTTIVNRGITLDTQPRPVLTATIEIDGEVVHPAVTVYPERQLRLPEVATLRRPLEDVQVILRSADDAGNVTITVNVEPLTQFVWLGATLIVFSMISTSGRSVRRSGRVPGLSRAVSPDGTEATR